MNNVDQGIHFIRQLQALGDLVIVVTFASGIVFTIVGTLLIPAAAKPMNSTSWFGRQVNPFDVVKFYIAGTLCIVLPFFADFSTGILYSQSATQWGQTNPFSYTTPSSNSGEDVYRFLIVTFCQTVGLIILAYVAFSIRKLGDQQQGKPFTFGKMIVLLLVAAAFLRPDLTVQLVAGIIPMLSPLVEIINGRQGY